MPSFNAMIARWQAMQVELPQYIEIIQAGIQKLQQYRERLTVVPAYTLSICKSIQPMFS